MYTLYKMQMFLIKSDASTILKFVFLCSKEQAVLQCGKSLLCDWRMSFFNVCRAMASSLSWSYWTGITVPSDADICCLPWRREASVWILWLRQPNWQDFASEGSGGGGVWVASLRERERQATTFPQNDKKRDKTRSCFMISCLIFPSTRSSSLSLSHGVQDTKQPTWAQSHSTVCNLD